MLPDKITRCHRTNFQETCHKCVTEYGCRLWKRVQLDVDRASGQTHHEIYDCIDSLTDTYFKNMLGRQDSTSASVDNLRKEVSQANDVAIVGTIARLNDRMDQALAVTASPSRKLLEG